MCGPMDYLSVLLIGIGLAMDAFAVSICKGLALKKPHIAQILLVGLWFGVFQFIMPVIGFYLGSSFYDLISDYSHYVAFLLLLIIGVNMIREAMADDEEVGDDLGIRTMFLLAVATSIDAMAVGISMAMDGGDIWTSALIIGVITFLISSFGVRIGSVFGDRFGPKAEIIGGSILIIIGLKILLENMNIF